MTSIDTLASSKQHAFHSRVLASVLLVLLSYGATAGAFHSHGKNTSRPHANSANTSISDSEESDSSSKQTPTGGECLACQLHQHLSSGLLSSLPHVTAPDLQVTFIAQSSIRVISQTSAPRRGRAPPTFHS